MEKAIEIKRRAQRCIQNGDLDGALFEYRKLIGVQDSDPYNFVLLADLLYKKGDSEEAASRYLDAARAYQTNSFYKNAIAVCKKMLRLQLRPVQVLERLGELHALDGLATEAQLYYTQHADFQMRENNLDVAAQSLRKAFEACTDDPRVLERLGQVQEMQGAPEAAARTLLEAARHFDRLGRLEEVRRCRERAIQLDPEAEAAAQAAEAARQPPLEETPPPPVGHEVESVLEGAGVETGPPRLALDVDRHREDEGLERFPRGGGTGTGDEGAGVAVADAAAEATPDEPAPAEGGGQVEVAPEKLPPAARIERLLLRAQESFRGGDRDAAQEALIEAARAYETLDRWEDAAVIFRNLGKGARVPERALRLWFANCERRGDRAEAAQVACELGDRALGSGDEDEARAWFGQALALDESCEHARRRIRRLANLNAAPAPPSASATGKVEVASRNSDTASFDLSLLLSEFEQGIESQLSGDAQSHYDLAMTYREMGLLDQAVEAFRRATADPAYAPRCAEMTGRCLLDQGRFEEAARELTAALGSPNLNHESAVGLRFQLGLALEAAGQLEQALAQFQQVFAQQASYPDVALKIRVLKKALEKV